jgi:hypothetical protein
MKLQDRIEDSLNELRIVLLGGQVFAAFAFNSCFQSRFAFLPRQALWVQATAITIITATFGWLLWPPAFHQIADAGLVTNRIDGLTTRVLDWGLFPLAVAVSLCTLPVAVALGFKHVWWPVAATLTAATIAWYGGALARKRPRHPHDEKRTEDLEQRIKFVLTECRIVLPGAQASLGFLFADVFVDSFAKLPRSSQYIHVTSLVLVLIATILLMTPAAYHRIATQGEPSESVHTVASWALLAALCFLAPGMGAELFVLLRKLTGHIGLSAVTAAAFVLFSYFLWFVFSAIARHQLNSPAKKKNAPQKGGAHS